MYPQFVVEALQLALNAFNTYEANYPEISGWMFAVNCKYEIRFSNKGLQPKVSVVLGPAFFTMVWKILKQAIPQKTAERIHLFTANCSPSHKDVIPQYISQDKLPVKYGGTVPDTLEV